MHDFRGGFICLWALSFFIYSQCKQNHHRACIKYVNQTSFTRIALHWGLQQAPVIVCIILAPTWMFVANLFSFPAASVKEKQLANVLMYPPVTSYALCILLRTASQLFLTFQGVEEKKMQNCPLHLPLFLCSLWVCIDVYSGVPLHEEICPLSLGVCLDAVYLCSGRWLQVGGPVPRRTRHAALAYLSSPLPAAPSFFPSLSPPVPPGVSQTLIEAHVHQSIHAHIRSQVHTHALLLHWHSGMYEWQCLRQLHAGGGGKVPGKVPDSTV